MSSSYSAQDIEVLEGLEPVRKRPGMYIGGTEGPAGLHHLVKEILDNSIDEVMNGHADSIDVVLHKDLSSITISDNGRGIPVDKHPQFKKSALELILTTLHAGGKFSDKNYFSAGGLHGVGASVVNALSSELTATVRRDGAVWEQNFVRGKPVEPIKKGAKTREHGTTIFFRPDDQIFRETTFSPDRLKKILEEKAFLNRGLCIRFVQEASDEEKEQVFCFKEGISSYLEKLLKDSDQKPVGNETFFMEKVDGVKVEVAFSWTESTKEQTHSYVNGIHTPEGGSHVDGFRTGLSKAVKNYANIHNLIPRGVKITLEDIREGLVTILSVTVPGSVAQLQFQGQTKDKLNNPEIAPFVDTLIKSFENELNTKPTLAGSLIERIVLAAKARIAARTASQSVSRKIGVSHRLNLPGKLSDCSSTKPENSEVFIVEGDSAGGSAKQGRDRKTQAVLPLRGKILNSIAVGEAKVKENRELADLVSALGCGFGKNLRVDRLRYGKVIILTDADADGMHIASLLMAFFFRFMRGLVEAGHLYIGLSPLFRIRVGGGVRAEDHWVYSEEERDNLVRSLPESRKIQITRFKGLGEMNPGTLWDTTLNPKTRNLLRVSIEDEEMATEMFNSLLGKDSVGRYQLIQENAHRLELDL
jgi:DNA gyrase subunit B